MAVTAPSATPARRRANLRALAVVTAVLLLAPALAAAHPDGGDPQTGSQQKCTNSVNNNWTKVSKAAGKDVEACLKNHAKGLPLTDNPGVTTVEQCIAFDAKGKVQKAKDKTAETFDKSCGGPARDAVDNEGFPVFPEYGATSPATVNAAGEQQGRDLAHDLFGPDLDAGVLVEESDPGDAKDAAKCQQQVAKAATKCMQERQKQFLKCKKTHLKEGGIYGLIYDPDDLALCFDGMDPAKIQKKCDGIAGQGIGKDVQNQCAGKVDDRTLAELFPPCATDDPAALATCLAEQVACRFCLSANAADGTERDCDLFDDGDGDNNTCLPCAAAVGYDSTYEAIQGIIFDSPVYGCTNNLLCHGSFAPQGGLDLTDDPNTPTIESYAQLVSVAGQGASPPTDRVVPGEPSQSFLYNKLAAATIPGHDPGGGSPMPSGGAPALTPEHLEAIEKWIRGGAPETLTVDGTALLLGSCLPEPDPLTIPPPDPPGAGVGVQFRQTPWPLPSESENEICMATVYDLTGTGLVPESAKVPCPTAFLPGRCTGGTNNMQGCTILADCPDQGGGTACDLTKGTPYNPTGECFAWKRQVLAQDPQSHHSIIHIYTGTYGHTDPGWGPFTYKFQDPNNPLEGDPCDPTAVDASGQNPGCSGEVQTAVACINFGPPDYSFGGGIGGGGSSAPQFSGSQEPYYEQGFAAGVYSVLPMGGMIAWNSHAFNLTDTDTTMSQYLNLDFAGPADQLYLVQQIFDAASIFVQDVPPFETREYCRTVTLPPNAQLFQLSSHTHRHGVLWRTWAPPNTVCTPGQPACVPRGDAPLYLSQDYTDPLQLEFDPPISHGGGFSQAAIEARTYLYCSVYDNGAGPGSPEVKRQSTSPSPPQDLPFGGPCPDLELQCIGGPNQGADCFEPNDAFLICDSVPGFGDCDACPVKGGVTTEDEMFIQLGLYYVP